MKAIVERQARGYYQMVDDTGLPQVTLFLSEERVDAMEDPAKLSVTIVMPGPNGEL